MININTALMLTLDGSANADERTAVATYIADLRQQLAHMTQWRDSAIRDGNEARAEAADLRRQLAECRARLAQPDAARTADAYDYPPTETIRVVERRRPGPLIADDDFDYQPE